MQSSSDTIYTPRFLRLCASSFLFFASFSMILPELPAYLSQLGGAEYKGLIISLFTLAAALSRPFSGKLTDHIGRKPVIFLGILVSLLAGLFYTVLVTVTGFLWLRFLHGFSTGFTPTGTSAYVADLAPPHRRGEAMGILGMISNIGTAFGPALGSEIAYQFSAQWMFLSASGFALLSLLVLLGLRETLSDPVAFRWAHLQVRKEEIFEKRVIVPSVVMVLSIFSFGVVLTLVPDFSEHLGLRNKGLFFSVYTLSSLGVRLIAGRISDLYGRKIVLQWALVVMVVAMACIAYAQTPTQFLWGAGIFGLAVGMSSPTLFAWTIDLSREAHRGRAIATVFIALEVGIGMGALLSGWLYDNQISRLPLAFLLAGGLAGLAWLFLSISRAWVPRIEN
ncbi:MAG: MFS transporter [Microscillaceae bacterium]